MQGHEPMPDARMLAIGLVIVLIAVFLGAFVHPLLFLVGLSVIIVAFIPRD